MKLGLINSAWFGSPVGTEEGIRKTREIGFDSIDIFSDPLDVSPAEQKKIIETCKQEQLPVVSFVCVALGLADFNPPVRRFHLQRAEEHLKAATEFGARNLLLVVGEYVWQQEVIPPRDQWNWAVESTQTLARTAASLGLEIAVEIEPFALSLIHNVADMVRFLDDVAHPAVKANIDVSHLALAHDEADQIAHLRNRIAHVHFSDCDGKKHGDLPPGRGVVLFEPYLKALKDNGYDGTISIELEYSPDPAQIVPWVQEAYRETNKLMQNQGIRQ